MKSFSNSRSFRGKQQAMLDLQKFIKTWRFLVALGGLQDLLLNIS